MSEKVVRLRQKPRPAGTSAARRARQPSTVQVLDALRRRIAQQEVAPGAKLREHELAEEFGVPRTRIREVFGALESRGLIERIPNRGAVVMRLDLEHVFQLYDVREVLEGLCVRLATQNAPPESWQDLVDHFRGPMATYVREGDFDAFIAGYEHLRQRIIDAAAQRGRRADAGQHLREDQRRDPPHHHPAGPRRGRLARAPGRDCRHARAATRRKPSS